MKTIVFTLIFFCTQAGQAYYGYGFSGIDRDLRKIKEKQECLERQNREQREYSECLERCRQQAESDRQMASLGVSTFSSGCYCSRPISIGCY